MWNRLTGLALAASVSFVVMGPAQGAELSVGDPAPKLTNVNWLQGEPVTEWKPGEVYVLDFWATWCGPCRMGLPGLQRLHEWAAQNKKPVAIYAVNLRETPQQVQEFWKQEKLTMPVLMDDGSLAKAYGVSGIPHTVVIVDGKVMDVKVGYAAGHENVLQRKIEAALAKPAP